MAIAHVAPILLDIKATMLRAVEVVEEAAARGAQLLAFPEAFLPGFPYWLNVHPPTRVGHLYRRSYQEAVDEQGDAYAPLAAVARAHDMVVVMGATRRQGGTLYNSLTCLDTNGSLLATREKLVPTAAERTLWGFGRRADLTAWPTAHARVSGMMCFEHIASLPREILARQRVEIHVAAWPGLAGMDGQEDLYHIRVDALARSHAITTQSFVLSTMNPITPGILERLEAEVGAPAPALRAAPAWSAVLHPSGATVAETKSDADEVLVTTIDLDQILDAKRVVDADGHSSRDDLYGVVNLAHPEQT